MQLKHGAHLAYCTNIHRGETWEETFASLEEHTLAVRAQVAPDRPFAIGLRLSDAASRTLVRPEILPRFAEWLQEKGCYVFTINGFPFGHFHGAKIKEQVYAPDWTSPERLAYTNRLFDILAALLPDGVEGSVSTVPGSFKDFITTPAQVDEIDANLRRCLQHIASLSERTDKKFHLGLEPEPFGFIENTTEMVRFFDRMQDDVARRHLGVNYDACHFALQFEDARASLDALRDHGIKLSKVHLSSALQLAPNDPGFGELARFADDTYLHQVMTRDRAGTLSRYRDLPVALEHAARDQEWRVHFHVPLYRPASAGLGNTSAHLLAVLDWLAENPTACSHLEMETYTWEVLPDEWKSASVSEQLVREYEWILPQLSRRGLA